jgi:hypothetical protein
MMRAHFQELTEPISWRSLLDDVMPTALSVLFAPMPQLKSLATTPRRLQATGDPFAPL